MGGGMRMGGVEIFQHGRGEGYEIIEICEGATLGLHEGYDNSWLIWRMRAIWERDLQVKGGMRTKILAVMVCLVAATLRAENVSLTNAGGGDYRWLDAADQQYSPTYRTTYSYEDAAVDVTYQALDGALTGHVTATALKPNFAYQLKLSGEPGEAGNENLGLAGRWWEETWNGSAWSSGQNLNNKGSSSIQYPEHNPNDDVYFAKRDVADATSPTGLHYRYMGYLVLDYFITDELGQASFDFATGSSYHVLWKTTQPSYTYTALDGPIVETTFDPAAGDLGYDTNYPSSTVDIFGEWERLPEGGIYLPTGDYDCMMVLTEESFHGTGVIPFAGNYAAAMQGEVIFTVAPEPASVGLVMWGILVVMRRRSRK